MRHLPGHLPPGEHALGTRHVGDVGERHDHAAKRSGKSCVLGTDAPAADSVLYRHIRRGAARERLLQLGHEWRPINIEVIPQAHAFHQLRLQ